MSYNILHLSDLHIGNTINYDPGEWGEHVGREIMHVYSGIVHKIIMSGDIFDKKVTSSLEQTEQKADTDTNGDRESASNYTQSSTAVGDSVQKGEESKTELVGSNEKQAEAGKTTEQTAATEQSGQILDENRRYDVESAVSSAVDFFDKLLYEINCAQKIEGVELGREDILFVPGNHDICSGENPWLLYDSFLEAFYSTTGIPDWYDKKSHAVVYTDHASKMQFLGFNSCGIRQGQVKYDLPYVDVNQIRLAETEVRKKENSECYRIAFFHHPNYMFLELARDDIKGTVVNTDSLTKELARWNVKAILHGHKHTSRMHILRPRIGQKIYHVAAGSIAKADAIYLSCNLIEVSGEGDSREMRLSRLNAENHETFCLNSESTEDDFSEGMLLENLPRYMKDEFDKENSDLAHILKMVNELYLNADSLYILISRTEYMELLLGSIRYRIQVWEARYGVQRDDEREASLAKAKTALYGILEKTLGAGRPNIATLLENARFIVDRTLRTEMETDKNLKCSIAYILLASMFTDIYMTFGKYWEEIVPESAQKRRSGIWSAVMFRGDSGVKYDIFFGYVHVRLACYDIEIEKALVNGLYEIRNRYISCWECLSSIGIKLKNIVPEIENRGMNGLGWYEIDASIPQMIRLLTGTNIYDSELVFAREVVQNAIDAISFREKLGQALEEWEKVIQVEIGQGNDGKYYFKIRDHGIGMGREIIEHYFTTLGKSYYKEYDEEENVRYNSISNFGIGFLSVFRPCREIVIRTRHVVEKIYYKLQIRDAQDYYLVDTKEDEQFGVGTEITCYLKDGDPELAGKLFQYLQERMLDVKYNIIVKLVGPNVGGCRGQLEAQSLSIKTEEILSRAVRRGSGNKIYIPFNEDEGAVREIDSLEQILSEEGITEYRHGMLIRMDADGESLVQPGEIAVLNAGVFMENASVKDILRLQEEPFQLHHVSIVMNFPPKWLEIDVSREKVNQFRSMKTTRDIRLEAGNAVGGETAANDGGLKEFKREVYESFHNQFAEILKTEAYKDTSLVSLTEVVGFMEVFQKEKEENIIADVPANLKLIVSFKNDKGKNKVEFQLRGSENFKEEFIRAREWILDVQYRYSNSQQDKAKAMHRSLTSLFEEICDSEAAAELIRAVEHPEKQNVIADILERTGISLKNKKKARFLPIAFAACLRWEKTGQNCNDSETDSQADSERDFRTDSDLVKAVKTLIYDTILRECTLGDICEKKRIFSVYWEEEKNARTDMSSTPLGEVICKIAGEDTVDMYEYIWNHIFLEIYERYYEPKDDIWKIVQEKGQRGYLAARDRIKGLYASNTENALIDVYMIAGCYADALLRLPQSLTERFVKKPATGGNLKYRWILNSVTQLVYVWKKAEHMTKPGDAEESDAMLEKWEKQCELIWPEKYGQYDRCLELLARSDAYSERFDISGFAELLRWLALYNEEHLG